MPSLMALAQNVSFTGLPLGVQRVKGLFEALFRRFAGIDSAANSRGHGFLTPKKRGPDHRVPVISRAIFDRLE
jgi:hypothetical protein